MQALKNADYSLGGAMDSAWLCLCGALVMFMHAGFAMLETGSCRAKNASNVLMKNLVNVTVGTLGWWVFGWAFAYGSQGDPANGFIGTSEFFGIGFYTIDETTGVITPLASCDADGCQSKMLSWFFQWAFCTAGATIVSGGVAERVKSPTYAVYAFFMASFIYPIIVAWSWGGGWLATVLDVGRGSAACNIVACWHAHQVMPCCPVAVHCCVVVARCCKATWTLPAAAWCT